MCLCKYYRHQSWKSLAWLVYILCFLAALLPLPNQPGAVEGELVWVGVDAAPPLVPFLTELSDVVSKKPIAKVRSLLQFNSLGQLHECHVGLQSTKDAQQKLGLEENLETTIFSHQTGIFH